ncbi:DUF943 family protein [Brenneria sp. 4F2]|nr:DUF943 family protein [Brenneria bubanii]
MFKTKYLAYFIALVMVVATALLIERKPQIMITDQELNFSNIALKNSPITDEGKIEWWKENQKLVKDKFNIPLPAKNGDWYINVWDYGDGFKAKPKGDLRILSSETQDMMCFNNDNSKCISKDLLMRIENNRDGSTSLEIGDKKTNIK